jgi:hypothetical protein
MDAPVLGRRRLIIATYIAGDGVVVSRSTELWDHGYTGICRSIHQELLTVVLTVVTGDNVILAVYTDAGVCVIPANVTDDEIVVSGDGDAVVTCSFGVITDYPVSPTLIGYADEFNTV